MSDRLITIIAHALTLITLVPMVCAVIWGMVQVARLSAIVWDIHATASTKPHAHIFAMANFFDERGLDQREKQLRAEGLKILGRIMLLFVISGSAIIGLVTLTAE